MSETLPPYNKELADLYKKRRLELADTTIGTKEAAIILADIDRISAEMFGGEIPEVDNPNLLSSISDWLVKDMIKAVFYEDYSSIGVGTDEEIQAAYGNLISQYHDACKNEYIKNYVQIKVKIENIEFKWKVINLIHEAMMVKYSETAAKTLNELFPAYQFTPESMANDFRMVGIGEIATKRTYDQLQEQLVKLEAGKTVKEAETAMDRHANFLNRLREINKFEGLKAVKPDTTTVLELAVHENALAAHIEYLAAQSKDNGSVN